MPFAIFDWLCVFAPMTGYFDQLFKMFQTKNSSKFKKGSSLVLLFSNFLRIIYWFGNRFAGYLLWQSVVTCIVHIALCYAYFKFIDLKAAVATPDPEAVGSSCCQIFNFHPFEVYTFLEFILVLFINWVAILAVMFLFCFFLKFSTIAEFVGLISNLIDSFQTFPPFFSIVVNRDISCTTNMLVMQYIAGTFFKAVLFLCRPVPWPFRVGVAIQAFFVSFISIEFYRKTCFSHTEKESDESDEQGSGAGSESVEISSDYSD